MEEIGNKAHEDELNKSQENIEKSPKKFISVPKVKKTRREEEDQQSSNSKKKNYG